MKTKSIFSPKPLFSLILAGAVSVGVLAYTVPLPVPAALAEEAVKVPAPKLRIQESGAQQVAIFAGGCFWGVEAVFSHVDGVKSAVSGYHGGNKADADYRKVSYGTTDHAEAVRVVYDPSKVSYTDLLQVFFSVTTDPTQLNRQGPDSGSQYRNAIVPLNKSQARAASAYIAQLDKANIWSKPVVTKIETYSGFYPAESYHQDFIMKNPRHPYIVRWDAPKVVNLKAYFPKLYKANAVTG